MLGHRLRCWFVIKQPRGQQPMFTGTQPDNASGINAIEACLSKYY